MSRTRCAKAEDDDSDPDPSRLEEDPESDDFVYLRCGERGVGGLLLLLPPAALRSGSDVLAIIRGRGWRSAPIRSDSGILIDRFIGRRANGWPLEAMAVASEAIGGFGPAGGEVVDSSGDGGCTFRGTVGK